MVGRAVFGLCWSREGTEKTRVLDKARDGNS